MTLHAAWKMDTQGASAPRQEISLIKVVGAQVLHDVIDRALQVHGSLGYSTDLPLEAMYRYARAARIYDGPDEVHRQSVARQVLRGYEPPAGGVPSEHVPTRREAARRNSRPCSTRSPRTTDAMAGGGGRVGPPVRLVVVLVVQVVLGAAIVLARSTASRSSAAAAAAPTAARGRPPAPRGRPATHDDRFDAARAFALERVPGRADRPAAGGLGRGSAHGRLRAPAAPARAATRPCPGPTAPPAQRRGPLPGRRPAIVVAAHYDTLDTPAGMPGPTTARRARRSSSSSRARCGARRARRAPRDALRALRRRGGARRPGLPADGAARLPRLRAGPPRRGRARSSCSTTSATGACACCGRGARTGGCGRACARRPARWAWAPSSRPGRGARDLRRPLAVPATPASRRSTSSTGPTASGTPCRTRSTRLAAIARRGGGGGAAPGAGAAPPRGHPRPPGTRTMGPWPSPLPRSSCWPRRAATAPASTARCRRSSARSSSTARPVYVRKEIVHNKHVVEQLRERGAVFVEELADEIPEGAITVFSAHGVSPAVHAEAERRACGRSTRPARW